MNPSTIKTPSLELYVSPEFSRRQGIGFGAGSVASHERGTQLRIGIPFAHMRLDRLAPHICMHILFVDDTFETRDLFRLCFTLEGHTAETAHNGLEALRIIDQNAEALDVIIMDYHMPGMNGLEVVQQLRENEALPDVPVIIFTGDTLGNIEGRAEELGVARVVYKPIVPSQLIAVAREVVNRA